MDIKARCGARGAPEHGLVVDITDQRSHRDEQSVTELQILMEVLQSERGMSPRTGAF